MLEDKRSESAEQNFWVSYADLMAGLLFVFILVVGAIVIKYVYLQADLKVANADINTYKEELNQTKENLRQKREKIDNLTNDIINAKKDNIKLEGSLEQLENIHKNLENDFNKTSTSLNITKALLAKEGEKLQDKIKTLGLKEDEIVNLKFVLNNLNSDYSSLSNQFNQTQKELDDTKNSLSKNKNDLNKTQGQLKLKNSELVKLKELLLDEEFQKNSLQDRLNNANKTISLQKEELNELEKKLFVKTQSYLKMVEDLNITKVKIRNLTGIRIKVIKELKNQLKDSIEIDQKSGAIRLSSSILFNQGDYKLKENAKKELKKIIKKYIDTLLYNKNINQHIDKIMIEGHTNSDGSYLYNLDLSQKRAFSVMKFIYDNNFASKKDLRKYLVATGRSYSDRIFIKGLFEDKDASRRIEIKFRIKNQKEIKEIEKFLDGQY